MDPDHVFEGEDADGEGAEGEEYPMVVVVYLGSSALYGVDGMGGLGLAYRNARDIRTPCATIV